MAIAKGDLTQPTPHANDDEIGDLVSAVAIMRNSQHELIAGMRQNSEALNRYATELAASARSGADASEAQSEDVSSMAAAVEQLSASIDTVEGNAQRASAATQRSATVSSEGGRIIHEAADEMGQIASAVNTTAGSIKELEEMSLRISGIVNVIREIADQTNLLALNAAIEAARAGEQGRGFAVVADEVRNLAARTGASTIEIANVVKNIQEDTHRAVQDMEAAVIRANEGVEHAHKAGDTVVSIRTESEQVSVAVNEITHALKEQAAASREISQKIERVALGAETNSTSATQTAASAKNMERLAHQLTALTSYFKV
jgi:methyl-accepting chemotaxis protein